MRLAILSRKKSLYSTKRLFDTAKERGHDVSVVDYAKCYMNITSKKPQVLFKGKPLRFDTVIPRIGVSMTHYGTAVVRQFEIMGVFSANESQAIARSRDKLLLEGTQGLGVVLAESRNAAQSVIGAFRQLDANILVQNFIKEAGGADLRCFVVDGKVVGSMLRQGPEGEFRSNLHRGGSASVVKLSPAERKTAVRSAKVLGLGVAGVDMLRANDGPVVMEVNSSPGLKGIETATGKDIAGAIIDYMERNAETDRKKDRINK